MIQKIVIDKKIQASKIHFVWTKKSRSESYQPIAAHITELR